ncbi:MAG TPA: glycosyltransferase [Geminicoccaceae bacterium]|nr:glycosyltransferase [Geminicoccaceae bacterium]
MTGLELLAALSLLAWVYLLLGRAGFWRARPRIEDEHPTPPRDWPAVVAVVPARDEEAHVASALRSLLDQDYRGGLAIVLVDDHSTDATRRIAENLATGGARSLEVIAAPELPGGWSGKLWAVEQGVRRAGERWPEARYLLLTDADIAHARNNLARLVAKADAEELDLVSLMVRLRCESFWERLLVPAFVFFFQLLYPFPAVNRARQRTAAAAGGCMLLRRQALAAAGGIAVIRDRLIDDVALARAVKHRPGGGWIWLGLGKTAWSLREYRGLASLWAMVARTADTQLKHSLLLLATTVLGMTLIFAGPPLAVLAWPIHGDAVAAGLGAAAWLVMAAVYRPITRWYELRWGWLLSLPLAALLFVTMTVDSALQHRRGSGGRWKGRVLTPEA